MYFFPNNCPQIALFIVMMLVFTSPDIETFKEEKVDSYSFPVHQNQPFNHDLSTQVLVTRKEILQENQTLPAPAITVCPYFIRNVSAKVKHGLWKIHVRSVCVNDHFVSLCTLYY